MWKRLASLVAIVVIGQVADREQRTRRGQFLQLESVVVKVLDKNSIVALERQVRCLVVVLEKRSS